jgi:transposase-like protein
MKTPTTLLCPACNSGNIAGHGRYETVHNGTRRLHGCGACGAVFSETAGTAMHGIKTPIGKVAAALRLRGEGMGLRATARILGTHKNTIAEWETRFGGMKPTLMLYGLCQTFIRLTFEGDEVYTVVGQRTDPADSTGWTAIILEWASRFLADQQCGRNDATLFKKVMKSVAAQVRRTRDTTFLSDGERRYGNALFELGARTVRTGKRGPAPPDVAERLSRAPQKQGRPTASGRVPKRPKYQAPQPEHPDTAPDFPEAAIHANHLEGHNAALRRRNSAFRRRTNTYAKNADALQRTLDAHLLQHNFVRPHWTTGEVPAVRLGILTAPLRLEEILMMQKAAGFPSSSVSPFPFRPSGKAAYSGLSPVPTSSKPRTKSSGAITASGRLIGINAWLMFFIAPSTRVLLMVIIGMENN